MIFGKGACKRAGIEIGLNFHRNCRQDFGQPRVSLKTKISTYLVVVVLLITPASSAVGKIAEGSKCKKVKQVKIVGDDTFVCKKKGKKKVWRELEKPSVDNSYIESEDKSSEDESEELPVIRPGAFCAKDLAGTVGMGSNGILYTCKTSSSENRLRWRR